MPKLKKPVNRGAGPVRRVTVELDVDLWKRAKIACVETGETLRNLLVRGLESELAKRKPRN